MLYSSHTQGECFRGNRFATKQQNRNTESRVKKIVSFALWWCPCEKKVTDWLWLTYTRPITFESWWNRRFIWDRQAADFNQISIIYVPKYWSDIRLSGQLFFFSQGCVNHWKQQNIFHQPIVKFIAIVKFEKLYSKYYMHHLKLYYNCSSFCIPLLNSMSHSLNEEIVFFVSFLPALVVPPSSIARRFALGI